MQACALTSSLSAPFVPAACQQLAARALRESDEASFAPVRAQFASRREYALDRLRAMGLEPECPAGGFFLWVPVAPLGFSGRAFAERLYKQEQVLVGPGDLYGPSGDGHVRISFAVEDGRLREGFLRLAAFVEGLKEPAAPLVEEEILEEVLVEDERKPAFSRA